MFDWYGIINNQCFVCFFFSFTFCINGTSKTESLYDCTSLLGVWQRTTLRKLMAHDVSCVLMALSVLGSTGNIIPVTRTTKQETFRTCFWDNTVCRQPGSHFYFIMNAVCLVLSFVKGFMFQAFGVHLTKEHLNNMWVTEALEKKRAWNKNGIIMMMMTFVSSLQSSF